MKQYQCPRQHLYNAPKGYDGPCPVCASLATAAADGSLHRTRGLWDAQAAALVTRELPPEEAAAAASAAAAVLATAGPALPPVLGWLVCVQGPDRGRDWRLVAGPNAIGRGEGMAVRLAGDTGVSRQRHAVLQADASGRFTLAHGGGPAPLFCNGQAVTDGVALQPHDRIELGASTLLFVPLVGPQFMWNVGP